MKTIRYGYTKGLTVLLMTLLFACSPSNQSPGERETQNQEPAQMKAAASSDSSTTGRQSGSGSISDPSILPVRFQSPTYAIAENKQLSDDFGEDDDFVVKVGADISSTSGPVVMRDIMKKLATLKKMNISWASDVDQYSYVDVDIRADDDFFKSIDNLLRQRDYFHEVEGNTIVIKYKETRKFHLAMPFMNTTYSSSVGGKVTDNTSMSIASSGNTFDIWENIKSNLDQVLDIWENTSASTAPPPAPAAASTTDATGSPAAAVTPAPVSRPQSAKGYYTIDKPVGLITVTAPRSIINKVESYVSNLKKELYRQINIEAKILEVRVSNERKIGIDWESLLNGSAFSGAITFGTSSSTNPIGSSGSRSFTIGSKSFSLLVSAIEKQGQTKVISNPKISVLNGQPALINVGKQVTYVKKVTETVDEGVTSYEVETEEKTSGIVMSVVATIMEDNEIILNLTPVTSQLEEPIPTVSFGAASVGLPTVNVKEMSTIVRVKAGEMLVVGGLIDSSNQDDNENVPFLGRLPLIKRLFSLEDKVKNQTELVILLKPEIIS